MLGMEIASRKLKEQLRQFNWRSLKREKDADGRISSSGYEISLPDPLVLYGRLGLLKSVLKQTTRDQFPLVYES